MREKAWLRPQIEGKEGEGLRGKLRFQRSVLARFTVLGPIAFDAKGDIPGRKPVWYVWRGGTYVPLEPSVAVH